MGTFTDFAADAALVAASCAYAHWLAEHKDLEPDMTWVEVSIGIGYCLCHALARSAQHGGDWRQAHIEVWRSVTLGAIPIVAGEIAQWVKRRKVRDELAKRWS